MAINTRMMPLAGINNRSEDAALVKGGDAPSVALREALNVDITETGRVNMRGALGVVSDVAYKNLWRSPLHGDLFGTLGAAWVKINPDDWSHVVLADLGSTGWASHCVLNSAVAVSNADGIWTYDGVQAVPLPMHTPGLPYVSAGGGTLAQGTYGVAVSWLRGTLESSVSEVAHVTVDEEGGGINVSLPFCLDASVTGARLYLTKPGSSELQAVEDYPIATTSASIVVMPELGGSPEFQHLDAMPGGRFMGLWAGQLLTAGTRTLHFSEPMAFHLYDRRHSFVQFPQRITFVAPVEGGVWVGQVDHVVFLSAGDSPGVFRLQRKAAQPPVFGSACLVNAELLGDLAAGYLAAVWLAGNGYVVGNAEGQMVELHAKALQGIRAGQGRTVVIGNRLMTTLE